MIRRVARHLWRRIFPSPQVVARAGWSVEFPHDVQPPPVILEQLRAIDPTAALFYLGWGKWMLASVRPNAALQAKARRGLWSAVRLLTLWERDQRFRANPGAFRRLYRRYLFWLAVSHGARPIAEYYPRFLRVHGFEAIVVDFRRMDWLYRTVSDTQLFDDNDPQGLDHEKARLRAEAEADLRDEYKALDAWMYAFGRLTHSTTRWDDPEKRRHRSGFTTVAAIGADGTLRSTA